MHASVTVRSLHLSNTFARSMWRADTVSDGRQRQVVQRPLRRALGGERLQSGGEQPGRHPGPVARLGGGGVRYSAS